NTAPILPPREVAEPAAAAREAAAGGRLVAVFPPSRHSGKIPQSLSPRSPACTASSGTLFKPRKDEAAAARKDQEQRAGREPAAVRAGDAANRYRSAELLPSNSPPTAKPSRK